MRLGALYSLSTARIQLQIRHLCHNLRWSIDRHLRYRYPTNINPACKIVQLISSECYHSSLVLFGQKSWPHFCQRRSWLRQQLRFRQFFRKQKNVSTNRQLCERVDHLPVQVLTLRKHEVKERGFWGRGGGLVVSAPA